MAQPDQTTSNSPQATRSSFAPILLSLLAVFAAAYFGFVRPAQQHMQSLERQCNKLVIAVKRLQTKDDTARRGLQLINLLDAQDEKIADAEQALTRFAELSVRLTEEAEQVVQASAALQQLEDVRAEVDRYSQTLISAADTLGAMAEVSASINASTDVAREANGSLATLGALQTDLASSIARLSTQLSVLEVQLSNRSERLPQARRSLAQIDQLCEQLAGETEGLTTAQQQLGLLAGLKQEVLEQSANVPAAAAALDQVWDINDGLLQAKSTIEKAQQLAIDMMLLEPVLERVAKSLQPVADATRLSRRDAARSPKTRQTVDTTKSHSPWSSAINVFVALLGAAQ